MERGRRTAKDLNKEGSKKNDIGINTHSKINPYPTNVENRVSS